MKRVVLLLMAAAVSTTFLVTILPPGAAAQRSSGLTCDCPPYTILCSQCTPLGPCCSPLGYCGGGRGYCAQCTCWQGSQYVYCDDCHCYGTCTSHNIKVASHDDDHHHRNHNVSAAAAAPTPSWHLMENMSSSSSVTSPSSSEVGPVHRYGSAAVCGQSAMDLASSVVPGQCLEVTNLENGKHAMVRVTGHKQYYCSNTSLLLEHGVFQQLVGTSGGNGDVQARHLPINYKYVRCIGN